jgi:hypothetical protein
MTEPFGRPTHDLDDDRMVETTETLRDDDPEVMPMDRGREEGEGPVAADRFGTTHAEEAAGESLDARLAEEEPDVDAHDPVDDVVADHPDTFGTPRPASEAGELDALGEDVSAEDLAVTGGDEPAGVGRLVEPDEGAHTDVEKDVVATDVGRDGGDLTAEEAAMHVEPE